MCAWSELKGACRQTSDAAFLCLPGALELLPVGASSCFVHLHLHNMDCSCSEPKACILFACLAQVEGSVKIWWALMGTETLATEASTSLADPTEYQWDQNKHEAKHKDEYMQVLQDKVGCRRLFLDVFQGSRVGFRPRHIIVSGACNIHQI